MLVLGSQKHDFPDIFRLEGCEKMALLLVIAGLISTLSHPYSN